MQCIFQHSKVWNTEKNVILKLKFSVVILPNEMPTLYSEEIICSVDRVRVSILFMLTLLLLVTNPSFPFLMPVNTPVLFKISFLVSMQQEKNSLCYKWRVTFSGTRTLKTDWSTSYRSVSPRISLQWNGSWELDWHLCY